jgi:hypothetical protein
VAEEGYKRLPTDGTASMVEIPQYGMHVMLAVWAAAVLPMVLLAWLVAPALADRLTGDGNVPMVKALLLCLTGGPDLAVRAARRTALARAAHVSLVDDSPSPLASLSKQPAERPLRRKAVADSDPAHRGIHGRGRRPMGDSPDDRDFSVFLDSNPGHAFLNGAWIFTLVV